MTALDLTGPCWTGRRKPFPFALELPLPLAQAPLAAGETPFIELPRLRPNPVQRQAMEGSSSAAIALQEHPGAADGQEPPPQPPSSTPDAIRGVGQTEFSDHPPSPSDASNPAGPVEDTPARRDPCSAGEPRGPSGHIISTDGPHSLAALPPDGSLSAEGAILPGLGPGGSLEAVLQCRLEQIQRWGHTPEQDLATPIAGFLDRITNAICRDAHGAREHHQARTGLEAVRKYLVKLAALCLAAIDRIDFELANTTTGED